MARFRSHLIALALASAVGAGTLAAASTATPAAADTIRWVSDIRVTSAFHDTDANCPSGYEKHGVDLNDNAGGYFEYLCLAYTADPAAQKVTDVWVVPYYPPAVPNTGQHPPDSRDGSQYCNTNTSGVIIEPVDLNEGVLWSTPQYFCFLKGVNANPDITAASGGVETLIHDITTLSFGDEPSSVYDECVNAAGNGAFPMSGGEATRGAESLNASLFGLYSPVFACIVGGPRAGEPGKPFLTDVTFADGDSGAACLAGYVQQAVDLNEGAGGHFIYPCMKHTADPAAQHVQDVWAIYRNATSTGDADCNYPGGHLHDVDLNDGAGGDYIYICTLDGAGPFTQSSHPELRTAVVGDIQFGVVSSDDDAESVCRRLLGTTAFPIPIGGDGSPANFNEGIYDGLFPAPNIAGCVLPAPPQPLHVAVNLFHPDGSRYFGGWTNHALNAVTECTGGYPPYVATPANPGTVTTTGATSQGTCRDAGGQSGSATSITPQIDTTPPTISTTSPTLTGTNGWYRTSPVTLGNSCTDAESGLATNNVHDVTTSFEGVSHADSGTCTDNAGNAAGPTITDVKIDTQAPGMDWTSDSPVVNSFGWHNVDVTVAWSCSDSNSGVGSHKTATDVVTGEGSSLFAEATCTDTAGNATTSTRGGYKVDRTPPKVETQSFSRAPDHDDWYTSNVSFAATCSDSLSLMDTQPAAKTISTEGIGQDTSVDCVDRAGNVKTVVSSTIKLDKSAPGATLTTRTPKSSNDWNNTAVDVAWTCSDSVSDVVATTISRRLSDEGGGQVASGTCENSAGLTTPVSEIVNIDTKAPAVTIWADRPPDENGWYASPFLLSAKCVDVGDSGLDGPGPFEASATINGETNGTTLENSCTDKAGNRGANSFSWKLDKTAPTAAITSVSPAPTSWGWHRTDVTLTGLCADSLSGPVVVTPTVTVTGEGDRTGTITCEDVAGHTTPASRTVHIDRTAPTLQIVMPGDGARYQVGTTITPDLRCTDALSGIAECRNDSTDANALDTSSAGPRIFSAIAVDKAGNTLRRTVVYSVADPTKTKAGGIFESGVLLGVKATVTNATTGKAVSGGVVHFKGENGVEVCRATTDTKGVAICKGVGLVLKLLLSGGTVTAQYDGSTYLMPSQGTDGLLS